MKHLAVLTLALSAVSASAVAQTQQTTKFQAAYVLCVMTALNRVDDGRSDPAAIAEATKYDCQAQWDAVVQEGSAQLRGRQAQAFQTAVDRERANLDRQIVLRFRKGMRGGAAANR